MINQIPEEDVQAQVGYYIDVALLDLELEMIISRFREEKSPIYDIGVGGSVATSPVVHEGVVYFGACDKRFYALDAETGRKLWDFSTNGPVNGSPTLHDNVIYFGSYDHNLYALSLEGSVLWRFPTQGKIFSKPCVHKGVVYFGSWDGNMYALDIKTGKEMWRFGTGHYILSWPVVHNNTLYFGSNDYNFYALSLDGKLKWKYPTGGEASIFNPVVHENMVFFNSFDRNLYAVNAESGSLVWRFPISGPPNTMVERKGDVLYFGSRNRNLYAVDTRGKQLWAFRGGDLSGGGLALHGNAVYVNGSDGNLYALDAGTGRLLWKFHAQGPVAHTKPAIHNGRVYFGSWDCNLYCVTTEGSLVWKFRTSLGYTAPIYLESEKEKSLEVVWKAPEDELTKRDAREEAPGQYVSQGQYGGGDDMRDYIGESIERTGPGMAYKGKRKIYRA